MDPNAREKHAGGEWYALAEKFADEWDQVAFDPNYDTLPLEHFEDRAARRLRHAALHLNPSELTRQSTPRRAHSTTLARISGSSATTPSRMTAFPAMTVVVTTEPDAA